MPYITCLTLLFDNKRHYSSNITHRTTLDDKLLPLQIKAKLIMNLLNYNSVSTPQSWAQNTNSMILRAQETRAESNRLRQEADRLEKRLTNELWQEWSRINEALRVKVNQMEDHSRQLHQRYTIVRNMYLRCTSSSPLMGAHQVIFINRLIFSILVESRNGGFDSWCRPVEAEYRGQGPSDPAHADPAAVALQPARPGKLPRSSPHGVCIIHRYFFHYIFSSYNIFLCINVMTIMNEKRQSINQSIKDNQDTKKNYSINHQLNSLVWYNIIN